MQKTSAAALIVFAGLIALPTTAMAASVHGHDVDVLEANLNEHGLDVDQLEEWGAYIRGWTTDANGNYRTVLLDQNLQPVR